MAYTVGCVPYVNAIPLVHAFEVLGDSSPVRVVYDVPSKLPALLESGEADAILVSSVDALRNPGRRMADGVCIGSFGPVKSVRLLSRLPFQSIKSLALDQSSMTSNRLAQILLREHFGVQPETRHEPPDLHQMLSSADACVLIGDIGMQASGEGLHVLDLGQAWTNLTGKPFVWAAWIGEERLTPELAHHLQEAATQPGPSLLDCAQRRSGWELGVLNDYLLSTMRYEMNAQMVEGLREFRDRLLSSGFEDCHHFPTLVPAAAPALG
ncbi:MAG TPA: menaquinone biosynthesis protein [Fimbriimonadaceae bacterium]|nr:menaquinone biosynthesis protein [Fimbriimonadaceae bacterium]